MANLMTFDQGLAITAVGPGDTKEVYSDWYGAANRALFFLMQAVEGIVHQAGNHLAYISKTDTEVLDRRQVRILAERNHIRARIYEDSENIEQIKIQSKLLINKSVVTAHSHELKIWLRNALKSLRVLRAEFVWLGDILRPLEGTTYSASKISRALTLGVLARV
jgi:hypothetical protein